MRVMIDSNVIVSAVYNPISKPADVLGIEHPAILTPTQYTEKYGSGL